MFQTQQLQPQQTYYYLARPLTFDPNKIIEWMMIFMMIVMMFKYLAPERA